jgi:hypothetical protein
METLKRTSRQHESSTDDVVKLCGVHRSLEKHQLRRHEVGSPSQDWTPQMDLAVPIGSLAARRGLAGQARPSELFGDATSLPTSSSPCSPSLWPFWTALLATAHSSTTYRRVISSLQPEPSPRPRNTSTTPAFPANMTKKSQAQVPDAWEDDWESQADKAVTNPPAPEPAPAPLSKRERLAQHAELNRKIWEAAYVFLSALV